MASEAQGFLTWRVQGHIGTHEVSSAKANKQIITAEAPTESRTVTYILSPAPCTEYKIALSNLQAAPVKLKMIKMLFSKRFFFSDLRYG